jgi:hypothetical protein
MKPEFNQLFFKRNTKITNFMKFRQAGTELFHAVGQRNRQKKSGLKVDVRNFE